MHFKKKKKGRKKSYKAKVNIIAGHRMLTTVILATQEAEIRRIAVGSHPGQIVQETLSRKKSSQKKGLVEWVKV
jgi:hypothetical protein